MNKHKSILIFTLILSILMVGCSSSKINSDISSLENSSSSIQGNNDTMIFQDDAGRKVEIPKNIERVAPCGSVAQIILYAIAPNKMCCLATKPQEAQKQYIDESMYRLPVTGQFYGKGDLNLESLISVKPQVIIDFGEKKDGISDDMEKISKQTGIPVIFMEATIDTYPETFRKIGDLLKVEDHANELAKYTEDVLTQAKELKLKINSKDVVSAMYATGDKGLSCNAKGSIQCGVLDVVGVDNAIVLDKVSSKNGGNTVTMEQIMKTDPEVILFDGGSYYDKVKDDPYWQGLSAVKNNRYYEIPSEPYKFLSNPPSINQIIGIRWLGNLLYPKIYDYDMVNEMQKFYKLFWHDDLTKEEAENLLKNSTLKADK